MGLNGYIIEKYNRMTNAYTCNRLVEEAGQQRIDLRIVGIYDSAVTPDGIINDKKLLARRNFVINRYKWGKVKDHINQLVDRSYNKIEAYKIYINKYEQVRNLHSNAFVMPGYILGNALLPYEMLADRLGVPFVAKGLESSMGEEIFLVQKEEELRELSVRFGKEKEWLFEELIRTSYGRDIRLYSIRGEAAACMQRKAQGDFRANVALGASVEPYGITPELIQIAKDLYEQTGIDFLGIDLLFGEDKPYFCEINVMPGIEGIEKATGVNIARRIIETIRRDFEDEQTGS